MIERTVLIVHDMCQLINTNSQQSKHTFDEI